MSAAHTPKGSKAGRSYQVGYGRPPVETRFKPGGIGNPKGRPKKQKTVGQMIENALTTRIRIEENGRTKFVTAQEFIFLKLVRAAARGEIRAIDTLFRLREPATVTAPRQLSISLSSAKTIERSWKSISPRWRIAAWTSLAPLACLRVHPRKTRAPPTEPGD